jgi:NitT/TauT family transport system substrate-binding protein
MRRGISAPLLLKGKAMFKIARAALGVSLLALVSSSALAADKITIGIVNAVSDGTLFIAQEKGYLKAEGIDADFVEFDTGAKMVAPMGAGQLDVGGGAASAGLYNAVDRGIRIKIVADKATNVKGAPFQSFMVRKALIDSGEVKTLADLKGRKVAITGAGGSDASVLNEAMRSVGLTYNDVEKIYLGFPQHAPAFQNGAIDGSITTEPTTTNIQRLGAAVVLTGNDAFYPNAQTATIMFSGDFAEKRRDVAVRFMKAYLRAARDFNDALVNGKLQGPGGDELVATALDLLFGLLQQVAQVRGLLREELLILRGEVFAFDEAVHRRGHFFVVAAFFEELPQIRVASRIEQSQTGEVSFRSELLRRGGE